MAILIHNATLLSATGSVGLHVTALPQHSLVLNGGFISEVDAAAVFERRLAAREFTDVVRADRCIAIPGLVNTHHHLYQSLTRCLPAAQNERLFGWLTRLYAHWRRLDYRSVNLAAQVSIAELLRHGCTTTSDHFYMFPPGSDVRMEAVLDAATALGLRIHLCRGSMSLGQSGGGLPPDDCVERDADVLRDCVRVLDAFHDPRPGALQRIDLAPCSPFNVTPELLRDTRTLARERGVLLHTHLAETLDEERFCRARFGRRPAEYLADLDWLGPDVYLAHGVHLNDHEIALLARTRTAVSVCPTSNLRLGSGQPPLARLLAAGVRTGLGVDGASSNDGGNPLAAAKLALLTARGGATGGADTRSPAPLSSAGGPAELEPALLPAAAVLHLATAGGAACLCRPELGHLAPGAAADVALFHMDDLALAGAATQDPVAALVLCDAPPAHRVYVAGREVVRDGRVLALDETALGREFNDLVAQRFT
jgi:8-oxoguanine deaminase